ncbi:MAG: hypothetical protein AB3N63_01030 [Puniceicoccaceae bacterium]
MISIVALWLPILVSAVLVFFASWLLHMFIPYHRTDYSKVDNEEAAQDALRSCNLPQGEFFIPHCDGPKQMKDPAYIEKLDKGPVAMITVMPNGQFNMGKSLALWFAYCIIVSILAAYITGQALAPGADYLKVFQIAGCTAFIAYFVALIQNSIWYYRKWSTTLKYMIDGLVYSLCTAGAFGWLWPGL